MTIAVQRDRCCQLRSSGPTCSAGIAVSKLHSSGALRLHKVNKGRPSIDSSFAATLTRDSYFWRAAILVPMTPRTSSSWIRAAELLILAVRSAGGHYQITGHVPSARCVVVLSFGYRIAPDAARAPGPCNEYLAALALAISNGRPIVTQIEIDQAIRSLRGGTGADYVIRSARDPDRYLDTHDFAVQVRLIMGSCGWTTVALVAHPHHFPRAQAVFASLGIETATPGGVRAIWDRRSSQLWTRGPLVWMIRELSALWLYQWRGWLSGPTTREVAPASRVRPDRGREHQ